MKILKIWINFENREDSENGVQVLKKRYNHFIFANVKELTHYMKLANFSKEINAYTFIHIWIQQNFNQSEFHDIELSRCVWYFFSFCYEGMTHYNCSRWLKSVRCMDSKEDYKVFNVWYKIRAHLTQTKHVNHLHKVLHKTLTQLCENFMQTWGNPLIPIPFALGSIKPVLSWIRKKIHTFSLGLVTCCIRFLVFRFCVSFCFSARNCCCLSFSYLRLYFFWQSTHRLLYLLYFFECTDPSDNILR